MNLLDIVIIAVLVLGFIRGYMRGFVFQSTTIFGALVSYLVAKTYAPLLADYMLQNLTEEKTFASVASFVALFITTWLLLSFIGRMVTKFISYVGLGLFNKILGGLLGLGIYLLVTSFAILGVNWLDKDNRIIKKTIKEQSLLYNSIGSITSRAIDDATKYTKENILKQ